MAETNDDRLDASPELVTDVTGTSVEPTTEMLEMTVRETEDGPLLVLEACESGVLGLADTKLKVEDKLDWGVVAPATTLVLQGR